MQKTLHLRAVPQTPDAESTQAPLRTIRRAKCALHQFSFPHIKDVFLALRSQRDGLGFDEVLRRLVQHGPNRPKARASTASDLRHLADTLKAQTCVVVRRLHHYGLADDPMLVPTRLVVPGDIVRLGAGDYVPADVRLIWQQQLVLARAILQPWPDACAMGDRVVAGTALAVVVATGNSTLLGMLMRSPPPRPSLFKSFRASMQRRAARASAVSASAAVAMFAGAAPPEARAESELTLYGTVDTGMAWTRVSGEATEKGLLSGGQTDSLWGLRGREALGNGSYAMFALEGGIDVANGRADDPDRLFNYQSWLGLGDEALGELRLGRQHTVGQSFVSEVEVGSWKDFGMGALMRASDNYQVSNQISWRSPTWAGAQFGASYSFDAGEQSDAGPRTRLYSLAARYEDGPWLLAASFEQLGRVSVAGSGQHRPNAWQLGVSYDLEVARIAAGWSRQRNGFVGRNGDDGPEELEALGLQGLGPLEFIAGGRLDVIYLGTAIPLGQGELELQWSQARPDWVWQDTGARAKRSQVMSVGYVHALSPRTSLYAFAAHGRGYSMDAVVSADEPRVRRVAFGLTHHF